MQSNHSKRSRASWGVFAVLWAALVYGGGAVWAAPVETVLHSFTGYPSDGAFPGRGLIADNKGNLYGTTCCGGASGKGTVFKLSPGGTETVLYSFCRLPNCTDGYGPYAGLIADSSGNLYGTTESGGNPACTNYLGCGMVFKLSPSGTEMVLYSFMGGSDGANPAASLIADSSGNLYGTTLNGGASKYYGTVFKLSPSGTETVLHSFEGTDGASPEAGLIADSSGNLYGTTEGGGAHGYGTVFKLSPGGTETVLYSFTGGSDGVNPTASLIADSSGNLYGTTGGGSSNAGVVFKLSPSGTETVLYTFCSLPTCSDGVDPNYLIADSSGNLYGTTCCGGAHGSGVVFKLSPGGTETVLHSFEGTDGGNPTAGLIADSKGNLYGTTLYGGATGNGVVFELTGTGFVTGVPFAAFNAKLAIDLDHKPNPDAFELNSEFTLGLNSKGINPVAEPVTLQIGTFTTTISAGSFKGTGFGPFTFNGKVGGVGLGVRIEPNGTNRYALKAEALNPNLAGTKNPVPVTLTIGSDSGTVSVKADIY